MLIQLLALKLSIVKHCSGKLEVQKRLSENTSLEHIIGCPTVTMSINRSLSIAICDYPNLAAHKHPQQAGSVPPGRCRLCIIV